MSVFKVLFAATELGSVVSVGGLGQVVASLATVLKKNGQDVKIALPYYKMLDGSKDLETPKLIWEGKIQFYDYCRVFVYSSSIQIHKTKIQLFLIKGHPWYEQAIIPEKIYSPDNAPEPYFYFSAALLAFLARYHSWTPDIIHCHDYHTGLISVYLKNKYNSRINRRSVATVLTIHNLGYQGIANSDLLNAVGLPVNLGEYSPDLAGMEFYGKVNCMKGAIIYSNITCTVSKTYAKEILMPEQGKGLEGVLQGICQGNRLKYILNGIDTEFWDPEKLYGHLAYNENDLSGKRNAKCELQKQMGLEQSDHPVLSIRSRWSRQKGLDVIIYALRKYGFFNHAQLLVISINDNTDPDYTGLWYELKGWASIHPGRIRFYDSKPESATLQYSGSDMILMPSLYEPCGLVALEAMRYGTPPIVRKTGGLADIVTPDVGFSFDWDFKEPMCQNDIYKGSDKIMETIEEAIEVYHHPVQWEGMVKNAMKKNHDWFTRIPDYEALYKHAMNHSERQLHLPFIWSKSLS